VIVLVFEHFWLLLVSFALISGISSVILPFVEIITLEFAKENYGKLRLFGSFGFVLAGLIVAKFQAPKDLVLQIYVGAFFLVLIFGLLLSFNVQDLKTHFLEERFNFKKALGFWLMIFFVQMSFGGFYDFFTIYEEQKGISLEYISFFWTVSIILEIAMFVFQTKILKAINFVTIIKFSVFLTTIRWLVLHFFSSSVIWVGFSSALHAFSFALLHSASISYLNQTYQQNKSLAQQFYLGIGYGLGGFAGSIIAGVFYGEYLFLIMAGFATLGLISLRKTTCS